VTNLIPFQLPFRQPLPLVIGNKDFQEYEQKLTRINELLDLAKTDIPFIAFALKQTEEMLKKKTLCKNKPSKKLSQKMKERAQRMAVQALRCSIARHLLAEPFRDFSCHLAESQFLRVFCHLDRLGPIKVPTKSTLERFEKMFPEEMLRRTISGLCLQASLPAADLQTAQALNLVDPINLNECYVDLTCLKADLHFPADWVLLRDAVRTLIKAILTIRRHGLKTRIPDPKSFIHEINKKCMAMAQAGRTIDSKRKRKNILRAMKRIVKTVRKHAERYKALLQAEWPQTNLSAKEAEQILKRMDNILDQLPAALKQAHERIIGERQVANADKILSLYDPDHHVLVRGKAGAAVEFGNTLLLMEQSDGLIVDWWLYQDDAPADSKTIPASVTRFRDNYGHDMKRLTGDRGCASRENSDLLKNHGIDDCLCPRSPSVLTRRLNNDEDFAAAQRRRAQTEARIGILKNVYLGRPLRSKKFTNRKLNTAWSVLAHNLCVLACLPQAERKEKIA